MRKPELDQVAIETPCPMKWADLDGDDKQRFCGECSLHVMNLSAMTRSEAETRIEEETATGERVCVTFKRDAAGELVNAPEVHRFSRLRALANAAASLLFGLVPLLGACKQAVQDVNVDAGVDPDADPGDCTELLGEMVMPVVEEDDVQALGGLGYEMGRLIAPQTGTTCEVPPPIEATGDDLGHDLGD